MTNGYDTLTYSKALIKAGEKPEVAEIHAYNLRKVIDDELVSKEYFNTHLDMQLKQLKYELTLTLGGIMVAGISVLAVLIKVL